MPKTLSGKVSAVFLTGFILEILIALFFLSTGKPFGDITYILLITPLLAVLGLVFSIIGTVKERSTNKAIPIATLVFSIGLLAIFLAILRYSFVFGE